MMTIVHILAGAVGLLALYSALLGLYAHTRRVLHNLNMLDLDVAQRRIDLTRTLYPVDGELPLLWSGEVLLDVGRGLVFAFDGLRAASPEVARPEQLRRLLKGAGGWPQVGGPDLPALLGQEGKWPERVDLVRLFQNRSPTIHDLVVGVSLTDSGEQRVISASLHDLMHVLAVGASGWGKSSWLRAFLWQIALAREPVEVVAIDVSGSEFNVLHRWGKLRYPVAREVGEAAALLGEVSKEVARRKRLYETHPLATKLTEYNQGPGETLAPWVTVIDEGTHLLNERGIGEPLRAAVQQARQYGIYILLAGQSAKHNVIDTQVRDNFSTRLCFRTSPTSSRVVLDDGAAGDLRVQGRAFVQLAGRELLEMQGPFIGRETFIKALTNSGPRLTMPAVTGSGEDPQAQRVRELAAQGKSKRQICLNVFGYTGGKAFEMVTEVLGDTTTTGGAVLDGTDDAA